MVPFLLFPLSPSPPLPFLPSSVFFLEVGPLKSGQGPGERRNLSSFQVGSGVKPHPKSILAHFSFNISHLVAEILM